MSVWVCSCVEEKLLREKKSHRKGGTPEEPSTAQEGGRERQKKILHPSLGKSRGRLHSDWAQLTLVRKSIYSTLICFSNCIQPWNTFIPPCSFQWVVLLSTLYSLTEQNHVLSWVSDIYRKPRWLEAGAITQVPLLFLVSGVAITEKVPGGS